MIDAGGNTVNYLGLRGGTGSGVLESTPAGFCVFLSQPDLDPESKNGEKPEPEPESLFHFGITVVCAVISLVKTWVNDSWIGDCNQSLNRSRILKFEL